MKYFFKQFIISIYQFMMFHLFSKKIIFKKDDKQKKAYLFLCPNYGNVGDLAIHFAELNLLKKFYDEKNILSISVKNTYRYMKDIKKKIKKEDTIYLIGGGSFGGLYPAADYGRLFLLKHFSDCHIISFPQTITVSNPRLITKYQKEMTKCTNFNFFLREKQSYDLACKYFSSTGVSIELVPDIVFQLKETIKLQKTRKELFVLSLRKDKEGLLTSTENELIKRQLLDWKYPYLEIDTTVNNFQMGRKREYFDNIIENYSQAKAVITDRLHGMIFSYITKTPCIVFSNNNGKIKNTYLSWLKKCKYIYFIQDPRELALCIQKIQKLTKDDYEFSVADQYAKLTSAINF